jgi:hypothetical protein
MATKRHHTYFDGRRVSSSRLLQLPKSIFGTISCVTTLCDINRLYRTCHQFNIIGTTNRSYIMQQVHLKPSIIMTLSSGCYRFANLVVAGGIDTEEVIDDGKYTREIINNSTIDALSEMTTLISLSCISVCDMGSINWKQLSTLQSLRSLNISWMRNQWFSINMMSNHHDFIALLPSLPSLRSLKLCDCSASAIPSGYLWPSSLESITMDAILDKCSLIHRMVKGDISIPPNLTELQMDSNRDNYEGKPALAVALHYLPHLRSLRLPRCSVDDPSLLPPATQLTSLTLFDVLDIDNIVPWVNELPSLSEICIFRTGMIALLNNFIVIISPHFI